MGEVKLNFVTHFIFERYNFPKAKVGDKGKIGELDFEVVEVNETEAIFRLESVQENEEEFIKKTGKALRTILEMKKETNKLNKEKNNE